MSNLKYFTEKVNSRLGEIDLARYPSELYEPIRYTLKMGGKRFRPVLCLFGCDLLGGDIEKALDTAIGIEIFHNFTLLHDDIMDQAPLRRGMETVHKKWNPNVAILSGDTMMALAYEYVMQAPENIRSKVFSVFNKTAIEVCEGQQYDMNFESASDITIADYIEMIRLKTAVLIAASLRIGAMIGGASSREAGLIYRFGELAGIAFQLKDDLLDAFSEGEQFGKIKGGDILANKKTFLYLKALEVANDKQKEKLNYYFGPGFHNPQNKVSEVLNIYKQLDIEQITEKEMQRYYQYALEALYSVKADENKKAALQRIAAELINRSY